MERFQVESFVSNAGLIINNYIKYYDKIPINQLMGNSIKKRNISSESCIEQTLRPSYDTAAPARSTTPTSELLKDQQNVGVA